MSPLPQNPDIMGTVTVGSDRQKPTSHASALRNWGFLPGAAEVGFFRSYPDRTPHDSRGRNWGRSELNRESDTPKGTGQLPACELVGWLKIEAQGCTEGPTAVHIRSTRKGVKPNPSFLSMGKGGFRVNLMNWSVSMTFRKVLCPHCRGKLETGQRIHQACIDPWLEAQQAKKERADAKAARMAAKADRASIKARKEAIKPRAKWLAECQAIVNRYVRLLALSRGDGCYTCSKVKHLGCITHKDDLDGVKLLHKAFGGTIYPERVQDNTVLWRVGLGVSNSALATRILPKLHKHSRLKKWKIEQLLSFHNQPHRLSEIKSTD